MSAGHELAPDVLPPGSTACPFVRPDGAVCGEPLNLWERVDHRRPLEWVPGRGWIAGPSRFEGGFGDDDEVCCTNLHYFAVPEIADYQ